LSARTGTNKDRSIRHEQLIATLYGGNRTSNSGAHIADLGDVRVKQGDRESQFLFECKTTGSPGKPAKSVLLNQFTKVAEEAAQEGRQPAMSLQFFAPDNPLAANDGYVTFTLRLSTDDVELVRKAGLNAN
jgi:hypothetical protein